MDFSRQISKKIDFIRQFYKNISISPGKFSFSKNFNFSGNFKKKFDFPGKNWPFLQLFLGKLFYFSSKVTTFEHTFCTR